MVGPRRPCVDRERNPTGMINQRDAIERTDPPAIEGEPSYQDNGMLACSNSFERSAIRVGVGGITPGRTVARTASIAH
jgi:hypothetical protein